MHSIWAEHGLHQFPGVVVFVIFLGGREEVVPAHVAFQTDHFLEVWRIRKFRRLRKFRRFSIFSIFRKITIFRRWEIGMNEIKFKGF